MIEEKKVGEKGMQEDEYESFRKMKIKRIDNITRFKKLKGQVYHKLANESSPSADNVNQIIIRAIKSELPAVPNPRFECPICQVFITNPITC